MGNGRPGSLRFYFFAEAQAQHHTALGGEVGAHPVTSLQDGVVDDREGLGATLNRRHAVAALELGKQF